jgi:excisionase family DNA binding protein
MKCITAKEAADRIGCSAWFLRKEVREHRVPVIRFGTRMLFNEDDIPAIIATYRVEPLARVSA